MSIQLETSVLDSEGRYSAPVWKRSIAVSLSVCLSVCEHISGTAGPIFAKFCVQIPCGHGSVLLSWRCDTLLVCTSGFMDDVTLGRIGPYESDVNALFSHAMMDIVISNGSPVIERQRSFAVTTGPVGVLVTCRGRKMKGMKTAGDSILGDLWFALKFDSNVS